MRAQYQQIIRDYDRGLITKAFAVYSLTVLLLNVAEDGLMPSDVAFILGYGPAEMRYEGLVH